ncbi:MAG TPA: HigA family addiction module antitoxin [Armatimonadota bacterium]|jgi:HTH-type transcriptional regulator/antitoxin HigA
MKRYDSDLVPAIAIHPGEILKEEIEARSMTQKELAEEMGRPVQVVNLIINGRKGISAETAVDLEKAIPEIPADFWLRLDASYRLNVVRIRQRDMRKAG